MEQISLKRRPLILVIFLLLILLGAGFLSFSFFLPRYIEQNILPDLGRQLSSALTGQVYNLGLTQADFGDFLLGDEQTPAASIASIHAEYSIPSLFAGKLARVSINSPTLNLEVSEGRLIIPGIDLQKYAPAPAEHKVSEHTPAIDPPIALDKLQVTNGLLNIRYEGEPLLVPFDLQMTKEPTGESDSVYRFGLRIMPQSQVIRFAGIIDLAGNKGVVTITADSLDLNRFAFLTGSRESAFYFGKTSIRGETEISLSPFQLVTAKLGIDTEALYFIKAALHFGSSIPGSVPAISMELKIDRQEWLIKVQGFMQKPLTASLELSGSAVQSDDNIIGDGNIVLRFADPADAKRDPPEKISLPGNPELHGKFIVTLDKDGIWQAELKSPDLEQQDKPTPFFHLLHDEISLQTGIPSLVVKGHGAVDAAEVKTSLIIPKVQAAYDGMEISTPEARLQASYKLEKYPDRGTISSGDMNIALGSSRFQKNGLKSKADIMLQGDMAPQVIRNLNSLQAEGRITLANMEVSEHDSGIRINVPEGLIPWHWPQAGRTTKGKINVSKIFWKDIDLGSFAADLKLQDMVYFLEGNYRSSLLKGVVTNVSGKTGIVDSVFSGELVLKNDVTPFAAIDLGRFDPSLKKSSFSGELGLEGFFKLETGGVKGRMQVKLQNGRYEFPDKKYTVSGIDMAMIMPSLPDLRTAPAQTIRIDQAAIGNLTFNKGKLLWQIESPDSIFLEEGVVSWAGGRIFTNAVRLSTSMKEFVVPIFCDRLKLTELLHQFGVSNAEGEGTVNGRIPLLVGKDTISFEDGFLYSSPGQGGSVKISALELLSAGIPKNTPQFAQIDFAAEALKNFQYNWVKLLLNSEGEDLVMQMQMDGKPVQSLPFKYDSQTGILQRIEDSSQGINQPIRLDVNFRLPLNRFLGYSGKIQDILKKIK